MHQMLIICRLITEWRIQKRVEAQFKSFVEGFNELIPADLVNVFDERELELLIGGIADIDVDDWKKHTDYRGYTEQDEVIRNFWAVCILELRLFVFANQSSSAFEVGTLNRNPAYFNLQPVLRESQLTDLKICRAAMVPGDLQLRRLGT